MKKLFTALFVCMSFIAFSQKEANIWYFGNNAGLDFNSGSPVVLTNSAMSQAEGVSSISDANGNLLFYTDGATVWNANHVVMTNGNGLMGNGSTTQSALIVQQPGSSTLYYIFTLDAQLAPNGFNYSIVDISQSGGLGSVTVKNTFIYTPSSEKITAITHANGTDVWIITHDPANNNFQCYTLTPAGFNASPVVSSVGPSLTSSNDVIGYLKVSTDGSKLAMAMSNANQFWLFSFNPATGVVSNPIQLTSSSAGGGGGAYGVEFSPNSNILYGSVETAQPTVHLYQWDLSSGNAATINASRIDLNPTIINAFYMGSLSLAPDNKIYFTRNTCDYLGCISDPDVLGLGCNLIDSAIYLQGKSCIYGLPNLNMSLYNSGFTFTEVCFGDTAHFEIPNNSLLFGAQWDFDDPASGANNTSFLLTPDHYFTAPGTYMVKVLKFYASYTDTVIKPVTIHALPVISLGPDTVFCPGSTFTFNAGGNFSTYLWHDNSTDSLFSTTQPGTFWVSVSEDGCYATDSVVLGVAVCNVPAANFFSSDTTFCGKQCIDFTDISTNSPTSWQWFFPGSDSTTSNVQNPTGICYNSYGIFDVTLIACNAAGCDTIAISSFIAEYQLPAQPVITQSNDTLYTTNAFSYAWYNSANPGTVVSTSSFYTTSNGGSYFVIVTDSNGCQNSSAIFTATGIHVESNPEAAFTLSANPVNDLLTVSLNNSVKSAELTIVNGMGQLVFNQFISSPEIKVNMRKHANGMYYVFLKTGKEIFKQKILVNH